MTSRTHARRLYVHRARIHLVACAHIHIRHPNKTSTTMMSALSYHQERRTPRDLQEGDGASAKESRPFWVSREEKRHSLGTCRTRPSRESHDPAVILLFLSSFLAEKITANLTNRPRPRASATTFSYAPIVFFSYSACRIARGHESRRATRHGVTLFVQLSTKLVTRPTETDRPIRLSVRPSVPSVVVDAADHQLSGLPLVPQPPSPCQPLAFPSRTQGGHVTCRAERLLRLVSTGGASCRPARKRCRATCSFCTRCRIFFRFFFFFFFLEWKFGKILLSSHFFVRYKRDYKLQN